MTPQSSHLSWQPMGCPVSRANISICLLQCGALVKFYGQIIEFFSSELEE